MAVSGTIYGVVLNDTAELTALAPAFAQAPYNRPPAAPVVYIRPRLCVTSGGAPVPVPSGYDEIVVAATAGLLFARDACGVTAATAMDHVGAACLALDVSLSNGSYYRPAVAERCRDGFLPLGAFRGALVPQEIVTTIDGVEAHRWSLTRLHRSVATLIADLSQFMTLQADDLLLVGLAGDAPKAKPGQKIVVEAAGFPALRTQSVEVGS